VTFPSRQSLARHIAAQVGRDPIAVIAMLVKFNDDAETVLAKYAQKRFAYGGKVYHSRQALAAALAPIVGREVAAVSARLNLDPSEMSARRRRGGDPILP